jgi:hypothetical protein
MKKTVEISRRESMNRKTVKTIVCFALVVVASAYTGR